MSKKMKLNLENLKVQSFITALTKEEKQKLEGASDGPNTQPVTICTLYCTPSGCTGTQTCC